MHELFKVNDIFQTLNQDSDSWFWSRRCNTILIVLL